MKMQSGNAQTSSEMSSFLGYDAETDAPPFQEARAPADLRDLYGNPGAAETFSAPGDSYSSDTPRPGHAHYSSNCLDVELLDRFDETLKGLDRIDAAEYWSRVNTISALLESAFQFVPDDSSYAQILGIVDHALGLIADNGATPSQARFLEDCSDKLRMERLSPRQVEEARFALHADFRMME